MLVISDAIWFISGLIRHKIGQGDEIPIKDFLDNLLLTCNFRKNETSHLYFDHLFCSKGNMQEHYTSDNVLSLVLND